MSALYNSLNITITRGLINRVATLGSQVGVSLFMTFGHVTAAEVCDWCLAIRAFRSFSCFLMCCGGEYEKGAMFYG